MTVHLVKLCVGPQSVDELAERQKFRWRTEKEIYHVTRMIPKRAEEIVGQGSIYWIMKGVIQVRQRILEIEPFRDQDGIRRCKLLFDRKLVPVRPQPRRAFQGWRYLKPGEAPADLGAGGADSVPPEMAAELRNLGLL